MSIIRNYGIFWSRDKVHWTRDDKDKRKGHLYGFCGKGKNKQFVDFRLQRGIYVLYSENREVIYVGQVGAGAKRRLFGRLKRHTQDHLRNRWKHFSWFGLCDVNFDIKALTDWNAAEHEDISAALNELEAILILLFEPRLNMSRGNWKTTQEFIQGAPDEPALSEDEDEEDVISED